MIRNKPNTKLLVDGGDPNETRRIRDLLGSIDGQTTNPSLVAKNPELKQRLGTGQGLSAKEEEEEYKRIVRSISPLVGDAGVSIEVFADLNTTAEQMLEQGKEMFAWIPNAYIKYSCTHEGLRSANMSIKLGLRVNMTLCFSQEQAAAVYSATMGSPSPVYVSPFVGRLDDTGVNGIDLVKNIKKMYERSDHHVHVLAASLRHVDHLLASFHLRTELATAPVKVFENCAECGYPLPDHKYAYKALGREGKLMKPIEYTELNLDAPWETLDLAHELTTKGIQKFVADYEATLKRS